MSQTIITTTFEKWKATESANGKPVVLDEFVFAYVPGLDPSAPIDRNEVLPPVAQIVHRQAVNKIGVVNANAVVYSVTMGTEIGDFDFNAIYLVNKAANMAAMIVHAPTQRKVANNSGQQGNVLTRSFLMEYNGAAVETGITTPAETWQIDFTARLSGIDEMQRLINVDTYGSGAFLGEGFLVAKAGAQYFVTKGLGYVGGLRATLDVNQNISVITRPVKVWADVSYQGNLVSQWRTVTAIVLASTLTDYTDNTGFKHYVFAVASIDAAGNITDLRPRGSIIELAFGDTLLKHEQSRNHPDGTLTAKGFVQLSSDTTSADETKAATSKAVKTVNDSANTALSQHVQSRNHPDGTLTAKGFVQLSSDTTSADETKAATSKAVKTVNDNANTKLSRDANLFDVPNKEAGRVNLNVYDRSEVYNITGANNQFLQRLNNGADIPNPATFRAALSLASAALRNVGITAGTIPLMDYFEFVGNTVAGYIKLPNGARIHWQETGNVAAGGSDFGYWSYPFPQACLFAIAVPRGYYVNDKAGGIVAGEFSNIAVQLFNWGAITTPARLIGIGL